MFADVAYAMGAPSGGGAMGSLTSFLPLILMFVVFYFLLIWPQQKKAKAHKQVLSNLQKGDNVVTSSGIYGTITGITDPVVTLEVAQKGRIKVTPRSHAGGD